MPKPSGPSLPSAALDWLVGPTPVRVVSIGCSRGVLERLIQAGHGIVALDADPARVAALRPRNAAPGQFVSAAASPDALPLQPCTAQVVLLGGSQTNQTSRLDQHETHAQISRALQPGGWTAGWQIRRDDSVPWVRRLIALMRSVDPQAMSGDQSDTHEQLLESKYFPRVERRDFRLWVPISRRDLVAMVTGQPGVEKLDEKERRTLIADASQIFDSAARVSELRLPYQLRCWQAHVDHHELTQPIIFNDGALIIPI